MFSLTRLIEKWSNLCHINLVTTTFYCVTSRYVVNQACNIPTRSEGYMSEWVSVKSSTSHSTHYRSHYRHFGDDFYRPDDQTNSVSIKTIWPCNAFLSYGTSVSGLCMSCTETFISDFLPLNGSTSYTCYGQPMHQIWTLPFSSSVI